MSLLEQMEDAILYLRMSKDVSHPMVASLVGRPMTDREKHRLAMRLEARFKGWAGESLTAFKIRTADDE